jgi:hypothetical protein
MEYINCTNGAAIGLDLEFYLLRQKEIKLELKLDGYREAKADLDLKYQVCQKT